MLSQGASSSSGEGTQKSAKRKAEHYPEGEEARVQEVDEIFEEEEVRNWVCEIGEKIEKEIVKEIEFDEAAWDDVRGGELNPEDVKKARNEEVGYMETRNIWSVKPVSDCWEKTGKAPVTVRWVDV